MRVGKPRNGEAYALHEINGINVYIHKGIKYAKNLLKIDVRKFLFIYEVYVYDPETVCFCSGDKTIPK